jgi:ATP-dependent Clp protease ATP-binding subunit ClpA
MNRDPQAMNAILENYRSVGLENMLEMEFGAIGQTFALKRIVEAIVGHVCHRIDKKPLVLFLPGPPGHGKTYTIRNLASALVGADNVHFVPCGTVKDDADLWGSNVGGIRGSRSALTVFLEERQNRRSIVVFDEFEKIRGLTNPFGWEQGKKIYQTMLEPFQEGHLSSVEFRDGQPSLRIDCSDTIFLCTSNLCQEQIIDFFSAHDAQLNKRNLSDFDMGFIRTELCEKILRKDLMKFFGDVDPELQVRLYALSFVSLHLFLSVSICISFSLSLHLSIYL